MGSISDSFCKNSICVKRKILQSNMIWMKCNVIQIGWEAVFIFKKHYYIKKIMSGGKNPVISPIISHCLHQYYSTFQWSIRLSLPILNTVKQYTLHFKTAFFWFPLNKPSEQIKMIKAGLVRKNASIIIIFFVTDGNKCKSKR